jgi:hypothetical protein
VKEDSKMTLKFGTCLAEIDGTKIISETDDELVVPAILAREAVLQYADGKAYRPADEIQKSLFTFDGAWITEAKHPEHLILTQPQQIKGRIMKPLWDVDIKGARGEVHIDKRKASPQFVADVKSGAKKDVSIGLLFEQVFTPGEFEGKKYDYVQRNILINHVAVGIPVGRGTRDGFPCGICVDAALPTETAIKATADPWEETEESIRSGHGNAEQAETCRTTDFDGKLPAGIQAIYCKKKGSEDWYIQSYVFNKKEDWNMAKAKEWFSAHNDSLTKTEADFAKAAHDAAKPETSEKKPPPEPKPAVDEIERNKQAITLAKRNKLA